VHVADEDPSAGAERGVQVVHRGRQVGHGAQGERGDRCVVGGGFERGGAGVAVTHLDGGPAVLGDDSVGAHQHPRAVVEPGDPAVLADGLPQRAERMARAAPDVEHRLAGLQRQGVYREPPEYVLPRLDPATAAVQPSEEVPEPPAAGQPSLVVGIGFHSIFCHAVGFGGVSLRRVAAEAGMSMGLVQHYFRSKEQMLLFAMDSVAERVQRRYADELAGLPDPPPPRAAVRALLIQWLPLDEQRRREGHSLFAFLGGDVRDGPIGERMRADIAQLQEFVTTQIRSAGARPDPRRSALILLAVNDGLAAHVLGGYLAPGEALAALDAHLDSIFGDR
jgi:AcrR family transcriptional regulator